MAHITRIQCKNFANAGFFDFINANNRMNGNKGALDGIKLGF